MYCKPLRHTLFNLYEGARIFTHIPGKGYVGVGIVSGPPVPLKEFVITEDGKSGNILDFKPLGTYLAKDADDPKLTEYFVPVQWIKTFPIDQAFWRKGMYAKQAVVTKLKDPDTLSQLREHFMVAE